MCGIVGVCNLSERPPVDEATLRQMLALLRHRGPDGFGLYHDEAVGLGHARLSIIDVSGGGQPMSNEDGTLWVVFNGEIFNYVELRAGLLARDHRFATHSDTEVILHLYEEHGPACLHHFNGQFAIALWDARRRRLFLARDRMGIRPLFYTLHDGRLIFGSEIKALLAHPGVAAEVDPAALAQIFTFWSTLSPRTVFRGIYDVPPGHYLLAEDGRFTLHPYWSLDFPQDAEAASGPAADADRALDELEALLVDATRLRLRADVPVGAYLSGGLDSSLTAAIIRRDTGNHLDTFSIAFADPQFDESAFQQQMAAFLGTHHRVVHCTYEDIGRAFPDVIWHTETPILRTSPAPMFLLSRLVHEHGLKVVLTGEGADEVLAGYDIFKEAKVRRFWARSPDSTLRPLLLQRLYADIPGLQRVGSAYLSAFFRKGLTDTAQPYYSHAIRWATTSRLHHLLRRDILPSASGNGAGEPYADLFAEAVRLPAAFARWSPLAQAQYLEMTIFLAQYLLSSQGDRVAMAHAVEGRFPFLDYRVVEFGNRLPPHLKLRGLTEKWLLKKLGRRLLPSLIWQRPKRPYRAPIHRSFFHEGAPAYVRAMLSPDAVRDAGLFDPAAVGQLVGKVERGGRLSEVDDMALVGVLSAQLVHHQFVRNFHLPPPVAASEPLRAGRSALQGA